MVCVSGTPAGKLLAQQRDSVTWGVWCMSGTPAGKTPGMLDTAV